jgi:hypothetical protein
MNNQANVVNAPQTKETKTVINLAKEGESATQFNLRMKREKRKATNEAGRALAQSINSDLKSFKIIRLMFATESIEASRLFCANLSAEIGKEITVEGVMKLSIASYMDYIKEIEAERGLIRGGINANEFQRAITRYYRGEKVSNFSKETRDVLVKSFEHSTEI